MAPSPYLFGLKNIAAAYAFAYASAHAEPSGHHQRFALDFSTTISTHTHTDSSEEDEAWARVDLMSTGPIFREVAGKFDMWRSRRWRSGFKSDAIRTLQPLHHCSIGYQPSTT